MTVMLYDDFERPDGPLGDPVTGGPYTVRSGGGLNIVGGYLTTATADTKVTFPAADDVEVSVVIPATAGPTTNAGPVVRYVSETDMWLLHVGTANTLLLYHRTGTTWTVVASVAVAGWMANGAEELRLRAHGRVVTAYRGDKPVVSVTDPWWTGQKHAAGFRFNANGQIAEVTAREVGAEERPALMPIDEDLTAARNVTARPYKGRDTKALDMESES